MPESGALAYDVFVSDQIPTTLTLPSGTPMQWSPLATTLISGRFDAVLVDPPFTVGQVHEVVDWIERSGKRLTQIYITHGHGDHWIGAAPIVDRFPGRPVYATESTIQRMHDHVPQHWRDLFGDQMPDVAVIAEPAPAAGLDLEGHELRPVDVGHSDCDDSTVLHVPDLGLVVAGDVAYNNVHQYLADGGFDGGIDQWLAAVDIVRDLEPSAVVAGHKDPGRPDDPAILDETAEYLESAGDVIQETPSGREFFDEMLRRYPDRINPGAVWLAAQQLD